jgi:hypothetical protein
MMEGGGIQKIEAGRSGVGSTMTSTDPRGGAVAYNNEDRGQ